MNRRLPPTIMLLCGMGTTKKFLATIEANRINITKRIPIVTLPVFVIPSFSATVLSELDGGFVNSELFILNIHF